MPLLPYDTLLIDSPLSVDQARERLQAATGPATWFHLGKPAYPFAGEVTAQGVRIQRAIGYQNSFLPRISGRIEPHGAGCRLVGTMSLHPLAAVFLAVWTGLALLLGTPAVLLGLSTGDFTEGLWIPPAMLVFAWVLSATAFTAEAHAARHRLAELLEGAPG